jgi:ribosomal protein L40E
MTEPSANRIDRDACLRCGATLELMGIEEFRVGGTSGGWKLLFGEWAELGEDKLQFEMRVCRTCRQVDLRVPQPE